MIIHRIDITAYVSQMAWSNHAEISDTQITFKISEETDSSYVLTDPKGYYTLTLAKQSIDTPLCSKQDDSQYAMYIYTKRKDIDVVKRELIAAMLGQLEIKQNLTKKLILKLQTSGV